MIGAAIILILICGIAAGFKDRLQFHFNTLKPVRWILWVVDRLTSKRPVFFTEQFWNPELSWKNKYRNRDPGQGEKFRHSTTLLVWLTDGYHLLQFFQLNGLILAIALVAPAPWIILFPILRLFYGLMFTIFYK